MSQERNPNIVNYTRDSDAQRVTRRMWSPLINLNTFLRSSTGSNFLKLINNSKAKDKGSHAPRRVWISDEKLLFFVSLIPPFKISLFEKLYQTLVTVFHRYIKNLEVRQKYSAARRIFKLSSRSLICDETLSRV